MSAPSFNKDYYGGALLIVVGASVAYVSQSYTIGTLAHMGPGYFPCALGVLIALCGVLLALGARRKPDASQEAALVGHNHGVPDLRGTVCIVLSTVAFYFMGEYFGLIPATFAIVFISGLGDRSNTLVQVLLLSLAMVLVAVVIFWWALQVQMPLVKWGIQP